MNNTYDLKGVIVLYHQPWWLEQGLNWKWTKNTNFETKCKKLSYYVVKKNGHTVPMQNHKNFHFNQEYFLIESCIAEEHMEADSMYITL